MIVGGCDFQDIDWFLSKREPVRAHHVDTLPARLRRRRADPSESERSNLVSLDYPRTVNYPDALIHRSGATPGNVKMAISLLECRLQRKSPQSNPLSRHVFSFLSWSDPVCPFDSVTRKVVRK